VDNLAQRHIRIISGLGQKENSDAGLWAAALAPPRPSHPDAVDRPCKDFRQELGVLFVLNNGQPAVDKALDRMKDAVWPSVELH
jgi:hypothetical protein